MASSEAELSPEKPLKNYLLENSLNFRRLCELRALGWSSAKGDEFFQSRRKKAYNTTEAERKSFYNMTCKIGSEMAKVTSAFTFRKSAPRVLDLCMAPGGFTSTVFERYPDAIVDAITLPPTQGGHEVRALGKNLNVSLDDVTMFGPELGVVDIPNSHPDVSCLTKEFPFQETNYDLIICGGAMLRNHETVEHRTIDQEVVRLLTSQLIIAFQRLRRHGTMVVLLHKVEAWNTLLILQVFDKISRVKLFKPWAAHAITSSFYLVASRVDTSQAEATDALARWKTLWEKATTGTRGDTEDHVREESVDREEELAVVENFGLRLVGLGDRIWKIQADALEKSSFMS